MRRGSHSRREFGADLAVDVATTDPVRALTRSCGFARRCGRRRHRERTGRARPGRVARARRAARSCWPARVASGDTPGFEPDLVVYKELRILGALGVDAVAYRAALDLLAAGRYPFAELPRRIVGLDNVDDLIRAMAGEGDPPPVHGVVAPHAR